jgi:hypothetical protein
MICCTCHLVEMLTLMRMVQEQNGVPGRMQAMGGTEHRILPRALITILTFSVGKKICLHTVPVVVWQISSCRGLLKESQPPGNVGSAPCQAGMAAAAAAIGLTEAPSPVTATLATATSEARNWTWASSGVWCLPAYPFTVLQTGSSAKAEACFCMEAH